MSIESIGLIVGLSVTSVGAIFTVYDRFANSDIKVQNKVSLIEQGCVLKHEGIEEKFKQVSDRQEEIKSDIKFIKENHLRHIEEDVRKISDGQIRILEVLKIKDKIDI